MNHTAPQYLLDIFLSLRHATEIERDFLLITYMDNTELSNKCIFQRLIKSWNSLPLSLRITNGIDAFKRELKTFYFKQAFESDS